MTLVSTKYKNWCRNFDSWLPSLATDRMRRHFVATSLSQLRQVRRSVGHSLGFSTSSPLEPRRVVLCSFLRIVSSLFLRVFISFLHNFIVVFSGRELAFTFAIGHRDSVCLSSVCLLSVTLVYPTQAVELFGNFFHHTIAQGLYFSDAKIRWWGTPLSP